MNKLPATVAQSEEFYNSVVHAIRSGNFIKHVGLILSGLKTKHSPEPNHYTLSAVNETEHCSIDQIRPNP